MKIGKFCLVLVWLVLVSCLATSLPAQQQQPMISPHAQAMPLQPFLDYLIDESMAMDIEEVAGLNQGWQPFIPDRLPRVEGMLWLRFTIAPLSPDARPQTFLLDMGQSVPGQPILYDPVQNELSGTREWRENIPAQRNILLLPEAGIDAAPCYIRLEGLPGPWFAPMIRTPQNAASNWDSLARTGSILALAVVMLLCILRGLSEKGQWRYWTALFVAFSLAQAILGMPRETQHFGMLDLAATLCPGLALMCLPHAGRHLMDAKRQSRSIDIQLFLLSLPGAALALLPLASGWNWLDRWVDIWPVCAALFIPTALGAWIMRLPGSRRFLLACVLPPIFVGIAMLGMEFGLSSSILASGPIWGVALAALLLAATKAPQAEIAGSVEPAPEGTRAEKKKKSMPALALDTPENDEIIHLEHPMDDPNLRIIQIEPEETAQPALEHMPASAPIARRSVSSIAMQAEEARENALREPIDDILRETAALRQCSLPPSAKEATAALTAAAQRLATILSSPELPDADEPEQPKMESFNLQKVVRTAHDSVAAIAECSGIALSWYMPPHLAQLYRGNARALEATLQLLLESSVRCSRHGAIKLTARQVPGSQEKGHLLFTVSDDGEGFPPHDRSSLALAKAWELTGLHGGYLSVESSPEGTTIAFTAHFTPDETELSEPEQASHVILASDEAETRRQLARIIEVIPCEVLEATNTGEVLTLQSQRPTCLLITQGRFARPAAGDMVREFCRLARSAGQMPCHVLAITKDDNQWGLLKTSGFTHAMLEPVDPEILRRTIAGLVKIKTDTTKLQDTEETERQNTEAQTDDSSPTMLIEQTFSLRSGFEGPDWLGKEETPPEPMPEQPLKATRQIVQKTASAPVNTPQAKNGAHQQPEIQRASAPASVTQPMTEATTRLEMPQHSADQPKTKEPAKTRLEIQQPISEPVVEKRPVERTNPAAESKATEQETPLTMQKSGTGRLRIDIPPTHQVQAPENAPEWVGEPTPVNRPLADYIVGVENHEQKSTKPVQPPHKAPADAPLDNSHRMKTFMEGSASLVKNALSGILKQKPEAEETPKPIQDNTLQASLDPVVVNLLATMETLMEEAQVSFVAKNCAGVAEATSQLVAESERFGLRILTRMAQCVERAAEAKDIAALQDLLPELSNAVERTRILIMQKQPGQ